MAFAAMQTLQLLIARRLNGGKVESASGYDCGWQQL